MLGLKFNDKDEEIVNFFCVFIKFLTTFVVVLHNK